MKTFDFKDTVFGVRHSLVRVSPALIFITLLFFYDRPRPIEIEVQTIELKYPSYRGYELTAESRDGKNFIVLQEAHNNNRTYIFFACLILAFSVAYAVLDPREEFHNKRRELIESKKQNNPHMATPRNPSD